MEAARVRANHTEAKLLEAIPPSVSRVFCPVEETPPWSAYSAQMHDAPKTTSEMAVDFDGKRGIFVYKTSTEINQLTFFGLFTRAIS